MDILDTDSVDRLGLSTGVCVYREDTIGRIEAADAYGDCSPTWTAQLFADRWRGLSHVFKAFEKLRSSRRLPSRFDCSGIIAANADDILSTRTTRTAVLVSPVRGLPLYGLLSASFGGRSVDLLLAYFYDREWPLMEAGLFS